MDEASITINESLSQKPRINDLAPSCENGKKHLNISQQMKIHQTEFLCTNTARVHTQSKDIQSKHAKTHN